MDPNVAWRTAVHHATRLIEIADDADDPAEVPDDAYEMAQFVLGLDEWTAKGGFPPQAFVTANGEIKKRLDAFAAIRRLLSAPEWPGASGMEDIAAIIERASGPIGTDPSVDWASH